MNLRRLLPLDDTRPFTGWHMLAVTVAFFAVVIAVNIVLAVSAATTFPGLVVENSYVASQHYNELLAEARAQQAAGWRLELDAPAGTVEARLSDAAGAPRRGLTVTALAARPSTEGEDRVLTFAEAGAGYRADQPLADGQWQIDLEARADGVLAFRELRRIFVVAEPRR
jgi:nitrogen fixation protein FixH